MRLLDVVTDYLPGPYALLNQKFWHDLRKRVEKAREVNLGRQKGSFLLHFLTDLEALGELTFCA